LGEGANKGKQPALAEAKEPKKNTAPYKPAKSESVEKSPEAVKQLSTNNLMTLNFYQVDVREALSAIAMKREINIVTATDVSGKISVHLYQVTLGQALDAITLAGGFSYNKHDDFYYVYKPKEARDPQAEDLQMRIFRLKFAEVDKVQEILEAVPGMRMIKIHEPTKTIVVEDTPENIGRIETIINYWDRMPKQVMIEAKILEIALTDDMSLGVNWEKIIGDARIGTGGFTTATMPTSVGVSPVPATGSGAFANVITAAGTGHQFTAALDAFQTMTKVNTLSAPKILTIHGKPARVQVGGKQGYKVTTTSDGTTVAGIEFIDTGTILRITPYIDDEGNILLNVQPSINSARIEEEIPVVTSTVVSTWLLAKSGETVFIGGLIQDTNTRTRQMVPCVGSIPGLGHLFGRSSQDRGKSELVVLITPRIVNAEVKGMGQEAIEKTRKIEQGFRQEPLTPNEQFYEFLTEPIESSREGR
jgi:type IV pilus secretin PilQ/predicted competence protein